MKKPNSRKLKLVTHRLVVIAGATEGDTDTMAADYSRRCTWQDPTCAPNTKRVECIA